MTDWDIVKDIVVLAGLIMTVTTPLLKLNTSITQLKALLDSVAKNVQQDEILQKHETRIHDLEKGAKL